MILLKEGQKEAYIFNQYIKGFGQLRALFVISLDQSHFPDFPGLIPCPNLAIVNFGRISAVPTRRCTVLDIFHDRGDLSKVSVSSDKLSNASVASQLVFSLSYPVSVYFAFFS